MQFPNTQPIFLNERMLNMWVERRTMRERQLASVVPICRTDEKARALFFPQVTKNCRPAFGDACPYLRNCWVAGYDINKDPEFVERTPHHELEIIGLEI